jgi:hypothetical protein
MALVRRQWPTENAVTTSTLQAYADRLTDAHRCQLQSPPPSIPPPHPHPYSPPPPPHLYLLTSPPCLPLPAPLPPPPRSAPRQLGGQSRHDVGAPPVAGSECCHYINAASICRQADFCSTSQGTSPPPPPPPTHPPTHPPTPQPLRWWHHRHRHRHRH